MTILALWLAIAMTILAYINAREKTKLETKVKTLNTEVDNLNDKIFRKDLSIKSLKTKIKENNKSHEEELQEINTAYAEELEEHRETKVKSTTYRTARNYAQHRVNELEDKIVKLTWNKNIKKWRPFNSKTK